jgi:molybdate transport repressor ModE-like protein
VFVIDKKKLILKKKVWLEYDGLPLLGKGRYSLLKSIETTKSLKKSAKSVGICERTAYNYIKNIERRIKEKIVESHIGGKAGGAYIALTKTGQDLIKEFERLKC